MPRAASANAGYPGRFLELTRGLTKRGTRDQWRPVCGNCGGREDGGICLATRMFWPVLSSGLRARLIEPTEGERHL
jgi:hypothetical protein